MNVPKFTTRGGRSIDELVALAASQKLIGLLSASDYSDTRRGGNELGRVPIVLEPAPSPIGVRYTEQRW